MNFPVAGEMLNGAKVISSDAKLEGDILKYEVWLLFELFIQTPLAFAKIK